MSPDKPEQNKLPTRETNRTGRRSFLLWMGRGLFTTALAAAAVRVLGGKRQDADDVPLDGRYAWQIDPDKCTYCGRCATACVRNPSAVRAVNDQKKCSNCVVCYGHIHNLGADSDKIEEQAKVCPFNAVERTNFSGGQDGLFLYTIRGDLCNGCGACALKCNTHGNKSMFLLIRPDLCLGCRECAIAEVCPSDALKIVPLQSATDFRPAFGNGG